MGLPGTGPLLSAAAVGAAPRTSVQRTAMTAKWCGAVRHRLRDRRVLPPMGTPSRCGSGTGVRSDEASVTYVYAGGPDVSRGLSPGADGRDVTEAAAVSGGTASTGYCRTDV
ncbi:hypothetical protein GCM10009566_28650 [Streptomyces murinus]